MGVYVVSRSRWSRGKTLEAIAPIWPDVTLVVPQYQLTEYTALAERHRVKILAYDGKEGIAWKREFVGQKATGDRFVMLDDDLVFLSRIPGTDRLKPILPSETFDMLLSIDTKLDHYSHVSVSPRAGNNRMSLPGIENTRPLRVLGYRKTDFLSCVHGRVQFMEDLDVALQLLRRGKKNYLLTEYAQDQAQTNAPGGCSDYRTLETHAESAKRLAELHPGFVKLRQKNNKTGGEFGTRLEVTVYWKKSYESSI